MTPENLAFVFLRLGAVLITCVIVTDIPNALELVASWLSGELEFYSSWFIQRIILFGLAGTLWICAGWLSRKVTAPVSDTTEKHSKQLSMKELLVVALVVVGLLILAVALPRLLLEIYGFLTRGFTSTRLDFIWVSSWPLIYELVPVLIGLVCVLSPQSIAKRTGLGPKETGANQ